jgi:ADP-ribosylglycohydrolase
MDRNSRMKLCIDGLSVGDSFGERFFVHPDVADALIESRAVPAPEWQFTDDTLMAISIAEILSTHGEINQDALAASFAARYDSSRGYGPAMHSWLQQISAGIPWRVAASSQFGGQGSYGNGAAMRAAPIGAYFADDLDRVFEQAIRSAQVSHTHHEGVAGAIAAAIAAGVAWQLRDASSTPTRSEFLDLVLPHLPDSEVKSRIRQARDMRESACIQLAVSVLGNGTGVSAQDTVPLALWCAGERLADFEEAMWLTVSGLGDRDTTCAIAGAIVAMYAGPESIPAEWLNSREPLPEWSPTNSSS